MGKNDEKKKSGISTLSGRLGAYDMIIMQLIVRKSESQEFCLPLN